MAQYKCVQPIQPLEHLTDSDRFSIDSSKIQISRNLSIQKEYSSDLKMAETIVDATPVATETPMETERTVEDDIDKILAGGADSRKYFSDFFYT
jgi:glyceraldehyde-3-phosphate dehydrogenase/erythrose-4-phosphate dehydrogenase